MGARFDETFAAAVVVVVVVVFVVVEAPAPLRRLYGFYYYYYYYPSSPDAAADDDYFSPLLISFCCFSSPVPPLLRSRGDCSRLNRSPPLYSFFPPLFSLLSSSSNDDDDAREREREREKARAMIKLLFEEEGTKFFSFFGSSSPPRILCQVVKCEGPRVTHTSKFSLVWKM